MASPTLTLEIAFATDPGATPTWTDVSAYLKSFATRRGRQNELDRFEAGTAEILLDNADRRFDPTYTSGPYYGNIRPMKKVRLSATYNAVTYRLFTGFIESWPQRWPLKLATAVVPIRAADGLKALNLVPLSTSYSSELSSTRVTNVLDTAGWLAADRLISTGQTTLQASTLASVSALQHLQDVNASENGRLFVDGSGRLVFQDRHTPYKPPYDASQATYGDGSGELDYTDLQLSFDDSVLYSDVRVTRVGGTEQVANSGGAIAAYFQRSISKTGMLMTTDSEAESAAYYLFGRYSTVGVRVEAITISPERDAANQYPQVLGREIGDRITIKRRPPGGGTISEDVILEGVEHTADISGYWTTVWRLSPASASAWWILESATNGILNETTRVAY